MHDATLVTTLGRDPHRFDGMVNTPLERTSTVLYPNVQAFESAKTHQGITYGRSGTATTYAFEEAIAALEGGYRSMAVASGLAAVVLPIVALTGPGDHLLVVDTAYGPTRAFCERAVQDRQVEVTYYDPVIGSGIEALIRPTTRLIVLEAPGSLTFEMQDIPAIVNVARRCGVPTLIDATWATPLFLKPLSLGVDVSVHAVTKYIGGHSDLMLGVITTGEAIHMRIRQGIYALGSHASPSDCWLALRGLRTLAVRMERHARSALTIAEWLAGRPEVERVLYPALTSDPGHDIWRRDFAGASGLFGVVLKSCSKAAVSAMIDGLELFGIGASWGGFESLCLPTYPVKIRTAVPWNPAGPSLRLHIGLEDPVDLIADLESGLARLRATG
jgi:cystathionine beta-lyase